MAATAHIPRVRSRLAVYLERLRELKEGPLDPATVERLAAAERAARLEWGQKLPARRGWLRPIYQAEE